MVKKCVKRIGISKKLMNQRVNMLHGESNKMGA